MVEEKARTWIKPYVRADGVRVHGHWRRAKPSGFRQLPRPSGFSDVQLRNVLSGIAHQETTGQTLLPEGDYPPHEVFFGLLDVDDEKGREQIADTLDKLGRVHAFRSSSSSPLRVCPIVNGQILTEDAPEDAVSSGCYNAAPRDPDITEADDVPCWPASIFVSVDHADDVGVSLLHEIGHYVDQQMFGRGKWKSVDEAFKAKRKSPLGKVMDALEASTAMQGIAATREAGGSVDAIVRRADGRTERTQIEIDKDYCNYLLNPAEAFARAYSQWVALRSGMRSSDEFFRNRTLSRGALYPEQWDDDDFEPIARALDKLFGHKA